MDARNQVKQYVDIAWRRKWWVVVPTIVGALVSVYWYATAPKMYRATTSILVTRQSMPEDIVRSTVTMRVDERMKTLRVQVLSRRYLEQVAREVGYIDEKAPEAAIERACDQVSGAVQIEMDKRDFSWFKINVVEKDPQRAATIANRLAEMFIQQNTEMREAVAKGTVDTVSGWLAENRGQLEAQERLIAAYKRQHMYELPDQQASTLQLMNASTARVQQLSSDIQLRSDRLAILRSNERAARANAQALGVTPPGDDPNAQALAKLERELNDLLVNYTEENPLVKRKRDQIAAYRVAYPAAATKTPSGEDVASPEIQGLQAEIRNLERDRAREQIKVNELQARLANMPLRQQELETMTRGYDSLKTSYDKTLAQQEQTERSLDLEAAKKGEQFQIQDRARAPGRPYDPQLFMLLLMGLGAGLGVGVGLTALLEFLDQSVRSEEQFAALFPDVTILGTIPNLVATTPAKSRAKGSAQKAAAGAIALAALLGGLLS